MSFNKTWNDVKNDDSIDLMEHPIFNTLIPKLEFYDEFGKVLDQLNGETMTDFVDFFFQRDAINNSNLKFTGENEKMDFYDWSVDEGCLPGLKEIHQGESAEDKKKRTAEEESERKRLEYIRKQRDKEREKRDNKIDKALEGFKKDYQIFKQKYQFIEIFEKNIC